MQINIANGDAVIYAVQDINCEKVLFLQKKKN